MSFGMRAIRAASCGSGTARSGSAFTITRKIPKCWPSRYGTLRVTWAVVQSDQMEGVERYLVEHWKPLVEDRPPKVVPIAVNSPFGG